MSVLSVSVINVGLLAKIFSVLCTGRTVTDPSILLKGLDHSDESVENNEIGLGKNCALMCNSGKLDVSQRLPTFSHLFLAKIENGLIFKLETFHLKDGGDGMCQKSTPLSCMCKSNILGSIQGYVYQPEVAGEEEFLTQSQCCCSPVAEQLQLFTSVTKISLRVDVFIKVFQAALLGCFSSQ